MGPRARRDPTCPESKKIGLFIEGDLELSAIHEVTYQSIGAQSHILGLTARSDCFPPNTQPPTPFYAVKSLIVQSLVKSIRDLLFSRGPSVVR